MMGMLAWDNSEACILKYACCVRLHQFACSVFLLNDFHFVWFGGLFAPFLLLILLRLHPLYFFMYIFSLFFIYFWKGINWCFVSYSFVSVKGPGRKLSLPTDLKTDLGTVGESQQFSLDFSFKSFGFCFCHIFSRPLCCSSSFFFFFKFPLKLYSSSFFVTLLLFNQPMRLYGWSLSILPLWCTFQLI